VSTPKVSVIMPTYNRKTLISRAIESVLNQDYLDWELVIVDDGSQDGTEDLIKEYVSKDSRIRYLYQINQGQSVARNTGIENSNGELIAFLDSDNMWEPHRLSVGVQALLENPDCILCYGNSISIDINDRELDRNNMRRYSGYVFPKLIVDNFISMNTVLVYKAALRSCRPFNENNRLDEDYELWLNLSVANKFIFIDEYLSRYRVEGERISNNFMTRLDANFKTVKDAIERHQLSANNPEIREGLSNMHFRRASIIGSNGIIFEAMKEIYKSLTLNSTWSSCKKAARIGMKTILYKSRAAKK
jgi:glycosyltransferase involved in cell wall biosynthesis